MGNRTIIRRFSQFFVGFSPHIFQVARLLEHFSWKLHGIVHNESAKSFGRANVHFLAFRSTLWTTKQELGDYLCFSWVLAHKFFKCQGSGRIFLKEIHGIIRNESTKSSSWLNAYFRAFRSTLWVIEQKLGDFFNFFMGVSPWIYQVPRIFQSLE